MSIPDWLGWRQASRRAYGGRVPDQVSVLVAGGGPVGLTLGVLLGHLGIGCVVAERRSGTSLLPRVTGVNVRSIEIFRGLGLEDSIRAVSLAGDGIPFLLVGETLTSPPRARVESEQYLSAMPAGWPSPTQALWCAQDQLEPLLLKAARSQDSTTVVFDTELVSFTAGDRSARTCVTSGPERSGRLRQTASSAPMGRAVPCVGYRESGPAGIRRLLMS